MAKRFVVFLMALVMVLGCFTFAQAEEEPVTLRVLWWGGQGRADATAKILEMFAEKYPHITVEYEFAGFGEYWDKLSAQASGGLLPDVIQMDYAYLNQYAKSNQLAVLDPYIESGALNMADVPQSKLASGIVDGKLYALLTGTTAPCLMYRKDVLDAAGVEMPAAPTMSQYIELSKTVYEKTGRKNCDIPAATLEEIRMAVRSKGMNLFNDEGNALGFDDPKYLVDAWQAVIDSAEGGYGLGVGEGSATVYTAQFIEDTWANWTTTNQVAMYATDSNCELEVCAMPVQDDATQAASFFKPTMFWAVTETSKNKDEAIKFIDYFVNETAVYDVVGIDRGLPISSKVLEYIAPSMDATSQKIVAYLDWMGQEGNSTAIMNPDSACYGELDALMNQYTEEVQYGVVTDLLAHAQNWMKEANEILKRTN